MPDLFNTLKHISRVIEYWNNIQGQNVTLIHTNYTIYTTE